MDPDAIAALLDLEAHPEGGRYRQTWREPGGAGTAIYFLLVAGESSHWHRIPSAEIWHAYAGDPVELRMSPDGMAEEVVVLGTDLAGGQRPQAVVAPGAWQAARSLGAWSLVGCSVSPAFDFATFELAPPGWAPLAVTVSPSWLAAQGDGVVICDVRWYLDGRDGRDAYRGGHLPGAVWIDLDAVLAAPPSPAAGRHPLPTPEAFAAGLAAAGIGDDDTVIAYDDTGGMTAARLVWMLRVTGARAALLDGGLAGWPGPLETGDVHRGAIARRRARPWPAGRLATKDELAAPAAGTVVIDARPPARYAGEHEPVDPRAGHIPGAHNLAWDANLGPGGRFAPAAELRARFAAAGIDEGTDTVAYCGSGVSACVDLLALEAAGLPAGRLYPGSWSQWSADPDAPVATGPQP